MLNDKYYNKRKLIKRFIFFFNEGICLLLLYKARNLYIISLKGCDGDEYSCLRNIQYINDGINYCILSSLYFLLYLFLIQFKFCSFYQIILFILIIFEFCLRDHGNNFKNHGMLNLVGFFVILIVGEIFINWDLGINGTKIDNDNSLYSCKINIPKFRCLIDIIGPFMEKNWISYYNHRL